MGDLLEIDGLPGLPFGNSFVSPAYTGCPAPVGNFL
jgi:hypothetical protein